MASKLIVSAADRNKGPILEVLKKVIPEKFGEKSVSVLEVGSGSGQHALFFSNEFPQIKWQPSDIDKSYLESIKEYIKDCTHQNINQPFFFNVGETKKQNWPETIDKYDMMVSINLVHISPWSSSVGLFNIAGCLLQHNGILVTYGPYSIHGEISPESNVAFDKQLKEENSEWGLRDIDDLEIEAKKNGLVLDARFDMPSNNKTLIWMKQ